ncbi:Bicaudal D-related 1 protein [Rutstroemia sp. NJR-2017a BBW]|nr:Bicaudal D-related 1 protein [Rutstroemia sp. NJR-2017a BBW]
MYNLYIGPQNIYLSSKATAAASTRSATLSALTSKHHYCTVPLRPAAQAQPIMSDLTLSYLIGHIPDSGQQQRGPRTSRTELGCCCGRTDCAFLVHNAEALEVLEREVRTAASVGQALLVRHEQYMVDAERDRLEMTAKIERLEGDKRELEVENKKTIEENRELLDQLEDLNDTYQESELQIKALETTLQSTKTEMRRLEILASRTGELEKNLAILEEEQEMLRKTIIHTEAEERNAILRWRRAERGMSDLQDQLERIEREARDERERHMEIMSRIERQRAVERELDTAAGRLKGAAAAAVVVGKDKTGPNVVSHFVKDILQDNANLQIGIVELREMLMNSNDEVQTLREQLLMHQPMYEDDNFGRGATSLGAELAPMEEEPEAKPREAQVVSQTLHIHHHYHTSKKEEARKPRKKRTSLSSGIFQPTAGARSPRTPRGPDNAILAQTAVTIPSPLNINSRWSVQSGQLSEFAPSSVPSSPQSIYRNSALFDRPFDIDSSRPTSPGSSIDPTSPKLYSTHHRKRGSEASARSFAALTNFQPHNVIHEEEDDDDVHEITDLQNDPDPPSLTDDNSHTTESSTNGDSWPSRNRGGAFGPKLHRSGSHESIVSIAGCDIHTLKSRPSQLSLTNGSGVASPLMRPRSRLATPETGKSMVTAVPVRGREGGWEGMGLRCLLNATRAGEMGGGARMLSPVGAAGERRAAATGAGTGLGQRVGGWVFGRWGVAPSPAKTASTGDLRGESLRERQEERRRISEGVRAGELGGELGVGGVYAGGRAWGINQKGPVPGWVRRTEKVPCKVSLGEGEVDLSALREGLEELGGGE